MANVIRIIPNKGVLFCVNDYLREALGAEKGKNPLRHVVAGASAGLVTTLTT